MRAREPEHYADMYANESEGACAPEPVCMFVLVCELTRPTTRGFATTHTDRCEDRGESERAGERARTVARGLAVQILLSSPSSVCLLLAHSVSVRLPLGRTLFPLCQTQRASLLLRGGNATGAKAAILSS